MSIEGSTTAIDKPLVRFSVIIPAWNESDQIVPTLNAIKEAMVNQPYQGEIIVVDNNSTDDTANKAADAGAKVVFEPINQIARARNKGAQASIGQWLVFIDADSRVNTALLSASLHAMAEGQVIGGGSTVAMDRELVGMPNRFLRFWNWWSVKSQTAAGCYIYCTKQAFDAVGQFDEKQFAAEELYLSRKLRKYAKNNQQQFLIQTHAPIVSSARKVQWYTPWQLFKQTVFLLIPGSTRSRVMCYMWYDRTNINSANDDSASNS